MWPICAISGIMVNDIQPNQVVVIGEAYYNFWFTNFPWKWVTMAPEGHGLQVLPDLDLGSKKWHPATKLWVPCNFCLIKFCQRAHLRLHRHQRPPFGSLYSGLQGMGLPVTLWGPPPCQLTHTYIALYKIDVGKNLPLLLVHRYHHLGRNVPST